jgi:hypothetical protein
MPTFLFNNPDGSVATMTCPPGTVALGTEGPIQAADVEVGDYVKFGGGTHRRVDEIQPDPE